MEIDFDFDGEIDFH